MSEAQNIVALSDRMAQQAREWAAKEPNRAAVHLKLAASWEKRARKFRKLIAKGC